MEHNAAGDGLGDSSHQQWLARLVAESARLGRPVAPLDDIGDFTARDGGPQIPPDQMDYLLSLLKVLLDGRSIVASYNYVLLVLLAGFTALHLLERRRCRKRWERRVHASFTTVDGEPKYNKSVPEVASSSSSSSSYGTTTPSGTVKDIAPDLERLPLLRPNHGQAKINKWARVKSRVDCWLEYQPRPLPLVRRTLPSNATSMFITIWVGINAFFHLYQVHLLDPKYFFCFADRAGLVFIVNLPLLYLLAAKNQPIKVLTGRSYEALNIFHRRVGEWMCFEAAVHFVSMVVWRFAPIKPAWLDGEGGAKAYFTHPLILLGIAAFVAYELLYFTSLGSFRQRWYEMFLASHVVLQIVALVFLYLHFHTARPYVLASLAIFIIDRVVWRIGLKTTTITTNLTVLPDGDTIMMSANWDKPAPARSWLYWPRHNIKFGWKPTDHVFLSVPALGRKHAFQAHPFTITSAAPVLERRTGGDQGQSTHYWLNLLIRAQKGFTADLLCYAHRHHSANVRLDGPYGSSHALEMLLAADNAILVAGGSGIAVTFPLVWALLMGEGLNEVSHNGALAPRGKKTHQRVRMMWIVHSDEHRYWLPSSTLDDLVAAGLDLVVPPSTAIAGRPDVVDTVERWIREAGDSETAVVVSGPDGLNRIVRNTCARAIGKGADVRLAVEKFGW
ncbi:hypothetical protein KVR01_006925 [Diaporthe batatas]|uniref:uncharacterized protein n=1 Tax=Diaporthe batatas TaxID=748121 RepID=UPI001D0501AC|nr:uncharacterized protein KVR01_006925 [Diaporthe batatas]KAG8163628.1 hypothetical protein KVR01_006925 [Diaporthe batatas]